MASRLTPAPGSHDHAEGAEHAPLTLVEYGDYQCPHCAAVYPVVKQLQQEFGTQLRFVFRNFPMAQLHEYALLASIAAEAAAKQGKYWEMHDQILEHQRSLNESYLLVFAKDIGLDLEVFQNDLEDETFTEKVENDFESGIRSGVNGTPSFFINGEKYEGPYTHEALSSALKAKL